MPGAAEPSTRPSPAGDFRLIASLGTQRHNRFATVSSVDLSPWRRASGASWHDPRVPRRVESDRQRASWIVLILCAALATLRQAMTRDEQLIGLAWQLVGPADGEAAAADAEPAAC